MQRLPRLAATRQPELAGTLEEHAWAKCSDHDKEGVEENDDTL